MSEWIGIAAMAQLSGLSTDTLRWYEKEGMLPHVCRGPDGRRRYGARERDLVLLLTTLRATGMPTGSMKRFVELLSEGAASHGRRIALLEDTRDLVDQRRRALDAASAALESKITHYRTLIEAGLDCDGAAVPAQQRSQQAARVALHAERATA